MSDLDIRFPVTVSLGAVGGPGFLTNIVVGNSGKEFPDQVWELERGQWEVSHAARLPSRYKPLRAFFRVAAGRANYWRFKDWTDFEVDADEGVFTQLTGTTFQMWKRYTFGAYSYDRKIKKPVDGTITTTGGTLASIDYATGIVTMASGTPASWAGEFDCHCRFDTDRMVALTIDKSKKGLIIGWSNITIVEIK